MKQTGKSPAFDPKSPPESRFGEIAWRKTFGISRFEADELIDAARRGNDPKNAYWAQLGERYGFVWTTVREIVGSDIGVDDPWLITAEVDGVRPAAPEDEDHDNPMRWLLGDHWSTLDMLILACAIALAITGLWGWGLILAFAWLIICAIIDPETGFDIKRRLERRND